jgi:hypothetical protein
MRSPLEILRAACDVTETQGGDLLPDFLACVGSPVVIR